MLEASLNFGNCAEVFKWSEYDVTQRRGRRHSKELLAQQDTSETTDTITGAIHIHRRQGSPQTERAALAIEPPAKHITFSAQVLGGGCCMSPIPLPLEKPFRPGRRAKSMPPTLAQKSWDMLKPSQVSEHQISAENYALLIGRPHPRTDAVEVEKEISTQLQNHLRIPFLAEGIAPRSAPLVAWNKYHHVGKSVLKETSLEDIFPSSPKMRTTGKENDENHDAESPPRPRVQAMRAHKKQTTEDESELAEHAAKSEVGTYLDLWPATLAKGAPNQSRSSVEQLGTYSFGPVQAQVQLRLSTGEAIAEDKDGKKVNISELIHAVKLSQDQGKRKKETGRYQYKQQALPAVPAAAAVKASKKPALLQLLGNSSCTPTSSLPATPSTATSTPCSNFGMSPCSATPSTVSSTPRFLISPSAAASSPEGMKPFASTKQKRAHASGWCDDPVLGA
jgi:hypothetical protein